MILKFFLYQIYVSSILVGFFVCFFRIFSYIHVYLSIFCFPWFPTPEIDGPQQLEVKDVTDSSVLISWYLPVAPSDRVAMFYMPSSDPSNQTMVDISPLDKQYSIDSLRPDTKYNVAIVSWLGGVSSDPVSTTFTTGWCLWNIKEFFRLSVSYTEHLGRMWIMSIMLIFKEMATLDLTINC